MTSPRILIVGVGSIGERHLRCFGETDRAILSICEVNDQLRDDIAGRYGVDRCFSGIDEVFEDLPDAAVICTPAHLHVPIAIRLAEAGVHLLIEKPLSTSLASVEQLLEIVEENRLTAGVAYVLRMHAVLAEMRDAIRSGRFGRPVQLIFQSGQHFPFYRPAYREIYYRDRATGGGAIQDALTHGLNAAEWLIGPITQVAADADHQVLDGVDVEDTVHVIARHDSVMACYSINQHQAANETTLTIVCTDGTLRCELHHQRWLWQISPEATWTEASRHSYERDDLFVAQAEMFLDALAGNCEVACSLSAALQTLKVNMAVLEAAEQREWRRL